MLDKRLTEVGEIRMAGGEIVVKGFSGDDCMCREVAALALLWAIGELQRELDDLIAQPGGSGRVVVD